MSNLPTKNTAKVCYYCGMPLTSSNRTIDHVVPLARGGVNRRENRVWCCRKCNIEKMDMTSIEFKKYKYFKTVYQGTSLIDICRDNGILLLPEERLERNKRERKKVLEDGYKRLS